MTSEETLGPRRDFTSAGVSGRCGGRPLAWLTHHNQAAMRICWLLIFVWTQLAWAQPSGLEAQPLRAARNLEQVIRAEGKSWEGSSEIWLLDLADGSRGVFRSEDEPWGSQAEVAGYRLSEWLHLKLVPLTVPRVIHRSEWPDANWPFSGDSRAGSLQRYLETGPTVSIDKLTRADIEVLSYIMGRYDNHSGNLVFDKQGKPWLVDFENTLEIQKTQYGQISYVRRGKPRPDLPSRSGPFPFETPDTLVNPSLKQIQSKFSPWWVYWTQGMSSLHQQTQHLKDRTVRYAIWDHHLWVQVRAGSRHPAWTKVYRDSTMRRLEQLDANQLRELLPPLYGEDHIASMLERARTVTRDWNTRSNLHK